MKILTIAALALCMTSGVAFAAVDTTARQVAPAKATTSHVQVAWGQNRSHTTTSPRGPILNGKTFGF